LHQGREGPNTQGRTAPHIRKYDKGKPLVTIQVKNASGGPAVGQTFEKFDKQVFKVNFDSFEGVGFPTVFDLTSKHLLSKSDPPVA